MFPHSLRRTLAALALLGLASASHAQSYMYAFSFGSRGTANGQFKGPKGVVVEPNNNILVVDGSNHRVQTFDANGHFLSAFDTMNTGPLGIGLQPNGNIVVGGSTLNTFNSAGHLLHSITPQYQNNATAAIFPNGFVATRLTPNVGPNQGRNYIALYDSNGNLVRNIGDVNAPPAAQLGIPEEMTVSSAGILYVVDTRKGVMKYDVNGNFLGNFGLDNLDGFAAGVSVDASGNVAVSSLSGSIFFFDRNDNFTGQLDTPSRLGDAFDVAFSPNGNLIVTNGINAMVSVFRPAAVPEPGGVALCFGVINAGAALFLLRRRRRK